MGKEAIGTSVSQLAILVNLYRKLAGSDFWHHSKIPQRQKSNLPRASHITPLHTKRAVVKIMSNTDFQK